VRFTVDQELALFAETVRDAVSGFAPELEPVFGEWLDDRDDALGGRLAELGWAELWVDPGLLGATVAGAAELGAVAAPLHVIDEATLGAPLAVAGRVRHGAGRSLFAAPTRGCGLELVAVERSRSEAALDSTGTLRIEAGSRTPIDREVAAARWRAWSAATLGYLAGLAAAAFARSLAHARTRRQFGIALASLPAVQQRLADSAVAVDGLQLTAWRAGVSDERGSALGVPALLWAGSACREVAATSHQLHGAAGFALETGVHVAYRRAKTVQVWTAAVCESAR
jgi:Acyl-CoA dehydrogenase, C-terminal domain